jgi:hypothetical protein
MRSSVIFLFAFRGSGTVAKGSQVHRRLFPLVPDFRWNREKDDSKQFLQVRHMLTITQVLDIGKHGFQKNLADMLTLGRRSVPV